MTSHSWPSLCNPSLSFIATAKNKEGTRGTCICRVKPFLSLPQPSTYASCRTAFGHSRGQTIESFDSWPMQKLGLPPCPSRAGGRARSKTVACPWLARIMHLEFEENKPPKSPAVTEPNQGTALRFQLHLILGRRCQARAQIAIFLAIAGGLNPHEIHEKGK